MRIRSWLATIAAAACVAVAAAAEAASGNVDQLVNRLGSGAYRDREAASRELDALGPTALDALRKAAASADPETRRRATDLVERIGARLAAARILAPTLIEFKYDHTPLLEAVEDLKRRTGAAITPQDATPNKFQGRTVTAATAGPTPFWDALDLFCQKADLHQWDGFSRAGGMANQPQPAQFNGNGFNGQVIVRSGRGRANVPAPNAIVLLDGPDVKLPSCRSGAVRVRIPPPGTTIDGVASVGADEVVLPLQISAEPKLHWQGALDVRVDRAVDDHGRPVVVLPALREAPADDFEPVFINGAIIMQHARRGGPLGVRVRRGDKSSARLAEMSGTIAGQVRVAEPLAVADAPLKSVGQTVRGSAGVQVKITAASRTDAGEVTIGAELHLPSDVQLAQPAAGGQAGVMIGGQMVIQGGGVIIQQQGGFGPPGQAPALPVGTTEYQGLSLEDARGRRFSVARGGLQMNRFAQDGSVYQLTATFKPAEAGHEPARLVFTGTRPATVDIPFALKDVPLP